jgi:adenylate cyclase
MVRDLGSTNGVFVNGVAVGSAPVAAGDVLRVGSFDLQVEGEGVDLGGASAPTLPLPAGPPRELLEATILRPVADIAAGLGLGGDAGGPVDDQREVRARAYGDSLVAALIGLARFLIRADTAEQVLTRTLDAAFEALPVDRGFILLLEGDELVCELARYGERVELRPAGEAPVSRTLLRTVIDRRLALVTTDARSDERLAGGESIQLHQIRSAMCAPLWSGERIVGVLQLDTPYRSDAFTEGDLELACALANYAAVAIERIRFARQAERERELRSRLERYHSPAVVEEALRGEGPEAAGRRPLKQAETTVLFADLVGFTRFSELSMPSEVAALLGEFFDLSVETVYAAGGTLDKLSGDCVLAFFGAPVEQSDHAVRAVTAAVAIRDAAARWREERAARGLPALAVRLALNSGPVVVGEVGSERRVDYTVLGNAVNVAARLEESVAGPGEVVIGPRTHQLLAGAIATEPLGERRLAGLERPIAAWRVLGGDAGG